MADARPEPQGVELGDVDPFYPVLAGRSYGFAMIGIGVQMGGPEQKDSDIRSALLKAMSVAEKARELEYDNGDDAWINPIFIVPGSIWTPEFEGFKLGHFSKKKRGLVVQIAVPQRVAEGVGIQQFVSEALRGSGAFVSCSFRFKANELFQPQGGKDYPTH